MLRNLMLDDIVALSVRLPIWLSIALGLLAYYGAQVWILDQWLPVYARKSNLEEIIVFNLIYFGGLCVQYLLPVLFAFGALLRIYWKIRYRLMSPKSMQDQIKSMSFNDFLINASTYLTNQGYQVELLSEQHDAPYNCILHKNGHQILMKCYHKRVFSTTQLREIKALHSLASKNKIPSCMAISSGLFSREARKYSLGKPVVLIDINELKRWS